MNKHKKIKELLADFALGELSEELERSAAQMHRAHRRTVGGYPDVRSRRAGDSRSGGASADSTATLRT
ncbi:MAG: hypothetical protein ACYTEK_00010 [Planctomycetota bacterium]|jgi:hypothetical protein